LSDEGEPGQRASQQLDRWLADAHQALVDDLGRVVDVEAGLRRIFGDRNGTTDG
jgi:hypothetical protein